MNNIEINKIKSILNENLRKIFPNSEAYISNLTINDSELAIECNEVFNVKEEYIEYIVDIFNISEYYDITNQLYENTCYDICAVKGCFDLSKINKLIVFQ